MAIFSATQIPKPSDAEVFQQQCKVLFEGILKDPNVKEYGTSGQGQEGVDLYGRRKHISLDHWVGIQCKLTIKKDKLTRTIVRDEANQALEFEPKLKEFIIATTAEDDVNLDKEARLITSEQAALGRDFEVQVWGWKTLRTHIIQDPRAIEAFFPDGSPTLNSVEKGVSQLLVGQSEQIATHQAVIQRLTILEATLKPINPALTAIDNSAYDTLLDRQIDAYRDQINGGKPVTAYDLLSRLWDTLPEGIDARIRFRIRANMAAAKLKVDDLLSAAELYLEAYSYAQSDPRAIAQKLIALNILQRSEEAIKFGREVISGTDDQAPIIANFITAAKSTPVDFDPLSYIPPSLADNSDILISKLDYVRTIGPACAWHEIAHRGAQLHPSDMYFRRFSAEAELDEVARQVNEPRTSLTDDMRRKIEHAASVLQQIWTETRSSEDAWTNYYLTLAANLVTCYRLLRDYRSAREVVQNAVAHAPDEPSLKECQLFIALEDGDNDQIRAILPSLPINRDTIFARLQLAANTQDWNEIIEICKTADQTDFVRTDQAFVASLGLVAKVKIDQIRDPHEEVANLLEEFRSEIVVPINLYEIAVHLEDPDWATAIFKRALDLSETASLAARQMLARVAARENASDAIIDLLYKHVETNRDTDELRLLARAFVNAKVRSSALEFAKALPDELANKPFYSRVIASIHFNRGALKQAEDHFRKAIEVNPKSIPAHEGLVQSLLRKDKRKDVEKHLQDLDINILEGSAFEKLRIAQLLVAFGRLKDGLEYGYQTALRAGDDAQVLKLYLSLILPGHHITNIVAIGPEVGIDSWVELEGEHGNKLMVVIEGGSDKPSIDHYNPEHPFAKELIGKRKGQKIVLEPTVGSGETWRVKEIKSKFVALAHNIMEALPRRFPTITGFYTFRTQEGDISPVLEQVKQSAERDELIVDLYLENNFPLILPARMLGKTSIEFASSLVNHGHTIRTCIGTTEELDAARSLAISAKGQGIALDTYTAWTAQALDLLTSLKETYRRIVVPQSSMDQLREWRIRFESNQNQPFFTIGYRDGQFFREEITVERIQSSIDTINRGIQKLEIECEILPTVTHIAPSELETAIHEMSGADVFDPIYVAAEHKLLLISEDARFRAIAKENHQCDGVWLQALLIESHLDNKLAFSDYAKAVSNLAISRHDHVTFDAPVLIEILKQSHLTEFDRFRQSLFFMGGPSADVRAHVNVAWEFMRHVWKLEIPYLTCSKACGCVLEKIAPMLARHGLLEACLVAMIRNSRRNEPLRNYIISWSAGHFIDFSKVRSDEDRMLPKLY